MNAMLEKRRLLANWLAETLDAFGNFSVETRLRRATFDSVNRAERLRIMGEPTAYAEVLWLGNGGDDQYSATVTEILHGHLFRVNIWLEYKDNGNYNLSSQAIFDDLCEGEGGVLTQLRELDAFEGEDCPILVLPPESVQVSEVSLDNAGKELAHFLTFTITLR